ncbi:MAG: hypothetical protein K8S99_03520 [Planctomycetes bacterium]|nr:hypothetical protein [Planctomycetota bacterium]
MTDDRFPAIREDQQIQWTDTTRPQLCSSCSRLIGPPARLCVYAWPRGGILCDTCAKRESPEEWALLLLRQIQAVIRDNPATDEPLEELAGLIEMRIRSDDGRLAYASEGESIEIAQAVARLDARIALRWAELVPDALVAASAETIRADDAKRHKGGCPF